jgi:hypothetical protein
VIGIEPSTQQLAAATPAAGVVYQQGAAEATGLGPATADLISAAQAAWRKAVERTLDCEDPLRG